MSCWAVIPLKSPERCKTRLASLLAPAARARLAREMFDVVLAAARSSCVERVLVVTAATFALPAGVLRVPDAERGLNEALAAARTIAVRGGAERLAIVAADLPLVKADDVNALVAVDTARAAIAPDREGTGTNALCIRARAPFALAFGVDSAQHHAASAARCGLGVELVRRPGLAFDVDTPADHEQLVASAPVGAASWVGAA